jgi:hypothetical protein
MDYNLCKELAETYPQFRERVHRQKNNFNVLGHKSLRTQKKWFRAQHGKKVVSEDTSSESSGKHGGGDVPTF